jgi:DNA replication protein DnaC
MKHDETAQLRANMLELRLHHMAEHYTEVLDEVARAAGSSLKALTRLIADELAAREERAMLRRITNAHLPKEKTLAEYDFTFPRRIAKQKLLRYFDCEFIKTHENLVLVGSQGIGKTHLLIALGHEACRKGVAVRFVRAIDMINDLVTAQHQGMLGKALRQYTRPELLLVDELGYLPVDKRGADLLFQVVSARYERGSIVITTNRHFKDWGTILDVDPTLASAMIDRLLHHGDAILIEGRSHRVKHLDLDA